MHQTTVKELLRTTTIPRLSGRTPGFPYFSLDALRAELQQLNQLVPAPTLVRYLHQLTKDNILFTAGRGWYSTLREPFTLDREPVRELIETLEQRFPLLDFSCWSTAQIAPFSHHQLARFVTFIHVERDAMETVADALRQAGRPAYINPTQAEVGKNVQLSDGVIIIRPAISRAPVDGKYATIEKILVDLHVEAAALGLMDEAEHRKILHNAISNSRISISALMNYGQDRRGTPVREWLAGPIN